MTVAELITEMFHANHSDDDVVIQADGWILVGPSEEACRVAWDAKQLHNTPLPEGITALTT